MSGPEGRDPERESEVRDFRVPQHDPVSVDGAPEHARAAAVDAPQNPASGHGAAASSAAALIANVLADRQAYAPLRAAARETIRDRYALDTCLPRQMSLLDEMSEGKLLDRLGRAA